MLGINIEGEFFNNLRFADYVTVVAEILPEIIGMLKDLIQRGREAGLEINMHKTTIIMNNGGDRNSENRRK